MTLFQNALKAAIKNIDSDNFSYREIPLSERDVI